MTKINAMTRDSAAISIYQRVAAVLQDETANGTDEECSQLREYADQRCLESAMDTLEAFRLISDHELLRSSPLLIMPLFVAARFLLGTSTSIMSSE